MLTFKNTNIVFLLLLMLMVSLNFTTGIMPVYLYLLLIIIYIGVVSYGCISIQSGFFIQSLCALKTSEKIIAISFDDGPAKSFTPDILKILKENNIEATFFCIGKNIPGNENILQQIINDGHIIGNHTNSHNSLFDIFSANKMLRDIQLMDDAMVSETGLKPALFRPPYGITNPNLKKAIIKGKYISVGWSVRSLDTVATDKNKLLDKINCRLHPGAIYLFHDTKSITTEVLPSFIQFVKENGYTIVRLDKMLNLKAYV